MARRILKHPEWHIDFCSGFHELTAATFYKLLLCNGIPDGTDVDII